MFVLTEYRKHVEERAALVELLKSPPAGEEHDVATESCQNLSTLTKLPD